jgi:hypothetical protein
MDQIAKKLPTSFITKHPKMYSNWDFWFENIPSGNPDCQAEKILAQSVMAIS